ncbi:MAG: DUF2147 domain-containing protein [Mesorhizobium sp.]|nr:DUF2147 domain-containing protein [Mesorhizobium sp.]MBL8575934.1 DUF2147 domain-containing protein [Mesorhizobium sp.]
MRGILVSVIAWSFACSAASANEIAIQGKWRREDGNALVRIAPCGKNICATNLWIRDTSNGEEVGDKLVMSLTPDKTNTYSGNAYDPKRKLNYSIVVTARKGGLVTRGCFVGKLVCKDVSWTAAN